MSAKKTILFIHHSSRVSGAEISLELLIKNLNAEQFRVLVLLPWEKGLFYHRLKQQSVKILRFPFLRFKKTYNPFLFIFYMINIVVNYILILSTIVLYNISVVHANTTHAYLYSFLPCMLYGSPCIWHIRDRIPAYLPVRLLQYYSSA